MKKLLSNGLGNIYQICKAFRNDFKSNYHNHEFTIVEWYRIGFNDKDLIKEIKELLLFLQDNIKFEFISYYNLFKHVFKKNPHNINLKELHVLIKQHIGNVIGLSHPNKYESLDILFNHCIIPFIKHKVIFIYDFPKIQAALSRIEYNNSGDLIAKRFELFFYGIELANGYYELNDYEEQKKRLEKDIFLRKIMKKNTVNIDKDLLNCFSTIPDCSGVALGLDRLIMLLEKKNNIDEVLYFD